MKYEKEVQCDYKILIDSFEVNKCDVQVYILPTKKSVKRYCKDTGMSFKEGIRKLYKG